MAQVRSWGWSGRARAQRAGGDGRWRCRVSCAAGGCRARRAEVVEFCASLPEPTRVAYEAGPTGYGLARALRAAGIGCVVAAPGKIERPAQDRIKTDQRDAERVLRLLMIDGLHAVRVPSSEQEALRDRVRARGSARRSDARAPAAGRLPARRGRNRSPGCAADQLPRPGGVRRQLRGAPPPGRNHQVRLAPRASAARRGGLALPQAARPRLGRSRAARTASPRTSCSGCWRPGSRLPIGAPVRPAPSSAGRARSGRVRALRARTRAR